MGSLYRAKVPVMAAGLPISFLIPPAWAPLLQTVRERRARLTGTLPSFSEIVRAAVYETLKFEGLIVEEAK